MDVPRSVRGDSPDAAWLLLSCFLLSSFLDINQQFVYQFFHDQIVSIYRLRKRVMP